MPEAVLQELARDREYMVRWGAVMNPMVSSGILTALAADPIDFIRREVARHLGTPASTLDVLADDHELKVRLAVAANPKTEWRTLQRMLEQIAADCMSNCQPS